MTNSSIFEIFVIKEEKSNTDANPQWVRARFSEKWSENDQKCFRDVLSGHQALIKSMKKMEGYLQIHKNQINHLELEYTVEEGEIFQNKYRNFPVEKLIEDEKRKMHVCEREISRIKAQIVFLESYMYCILTGTDQLWIFRQNEKS